MSSRESGYFVEEGGSCAEVGGWIRVEDEGEACLEEGGCMCVEDG